MAEWTYSTDLFDRSTIALMAEIFVELVESVVDDPDQTLSELIARIRVQA